MSVLRPFGFWIANQVLRRILVTGTKSSLISPMWLIHLQANSYFYHTVRPEHDRILGCWVSLSLLAVEQHHLGIA